MCSSEGQLILVRLLHAGILRRDYSDTPRTEIWAHGCRSATMVSLESLRFACFGFDVFVDFCLVGVVIGKGRMHLRQREVPEFPRDFFRNQTHVVPLSDAAN